MLITMKSNTGQRFLEMKTVNLIPGISKLSAVGWGRVGEGCMFEVIDEDHEN